MAPPNRSKAIPVAGTNIMNRFMVWLAAPRYRRKGYVFATWIDNNECENPFLVPWPGPGRQITIDNIGVEGKGLTFTPDEKHSTFKYGVKHFVFRGNSPVSVNMRANGHEASKHDLRPMIPDLADRLYSAYEATNDEGFLKDSKDLSRLAIDLSRDNGSILTADVIDDAMTVSHAATLRYARSGKLFGDKAKAVIGFSIFLGILLIMVVGVPVMMETFA